MNVSTRAAWACAYAAVGWRVFPVEAGQKTPPAGFHWRDWATTDSPTLRRWFPDDRKNLAVVTGELFDAFDIEAPHLPAFRGWAEVNGFVMPTTPVALTGRGGWHVLVAPTGRRTTKLVLGGVHIGELKAAGGYILLSPSRTVSQYRWLLAPAGMRPAPAADWLFGIVAEQPAPRPVHPVVSTAEALRRLEVLARAVAKTPPGNRNNVLYWAARRALEEGIPAVAMAQALARAADDAGCSPEEATATLRSAMASASLRR